MALASTHASSSLSTRFAPEVYHAAYAHVADQADALVLCDSAPAAAIDAIETVSQGGCGLGAVAMLVGLAQRDYHLIRFGNGGSVLRIARQPRVSITETGRATHLALISVEAERLLAVTRLERPLAVVAGRPLTLAPFDIQLAAAA